MSFPQAPGRNTGHLSSKIGYFNKDISVTTIYVGNLSYEIDEIDIKDIFSEFGVVTYVKIVKDSETFESKGIAFVQMPVKKQAELALKELNGAEIDERVIKVSIAVENDNSRTEAVTTKKRRKPYKPYISKADRAAAAASSAASNEVKSDS
ncbi:MAG: RNA recognition motif-containing protein [Bacteriovoracaceae bacterium]|jgi:RNA recognition motif-containing protein